MRSRQSRLIPGFTIMLVLAGCAAAPTPPAPPAVVKRAPPAPVAPTAETYRDVPLTPGAWSWTSDAKYSVAQFGTGTASALLILNCDRLNRRLTLMVPMPTAKPTTSTAPITATPAAPALSHVTITTTSVTNKLDMAANQASTNHMATQEIDANAPLLDAIVHSQGRFMVQVEGGLDLVIPTSGESARAVEDCRI
jgi:hypothetical protein